MAPGVFDPQLAALPAAQLAQLQAVMDGSPHAVILTGDLHSAADGTSTPAYADLLNAGFVDARTSGKPLGPGYASNQAADLSKERGPPAIPASQVMESPEIPGRFNRSPPRGWESVWAQLARERARELERLAAELER